MKKPQSLRDKIDALRTFYHDDDEWSEYPMVNKDKVLELLDQEECDHKFVGSKKCTKCGWKP